VIETGIADLITDLLHLADAADVDIEYALDSARRNYDEEREA
jgi:NTP pyrophosphatase (non-canonical NTP hydrolase)